MCYVMGGAELRDVIESLPHNILEHLNVSYSPCLGCGKGEQAPPFIEVNGKRIAGVSKNSLRGSKKCYMTILRCSRSVSY